MSTSLPTFTFFPRHLSGQSAWSGHLPFGYDLIKKFRPALLVELGTWKGDSFFTFCQSVAENQISAFCYGVDHWKGDIQAGEAESDLYQQVQSYCAANYAKFALLMRSSFADAAGQFSENTIDLLHIDGLHSYEAVSEDFHTWYPKVKPGGIILFHDVRVRTCDSRPQFGVWKFWEEVCAKGDSTFCFNHGYGLGILVKESNPEMEAWLKEMVQESYSSYYAQRGADLSLIAETQHVAEQVPVLREENQKLRQLASELAARKEQRAEEMYDPRQINGSQFESKLKRSEERRLSAERARKDICNQVESWNGGSWFRRAFHKLRIKEPNL